MASVEQSRSKRRAEAEARLLRAAAELVGELGPANVTLADVGERAGYSRGLATHHFGTKNALMERLVEVVSHNLLEDFAQAGTEGTVIDELLGLTRIYFDSILGRPPLARARLMLWALAVATPRDDRRVAMLAADREFRREIEQRIDRRVAAGDVPQATDAGALARVIVAMLRGIALQAVFDDRMDLETAQNEVEHMIMERLRHDVAKDGGQVL
jgi:AcrR family transcriptional regulator